MHDVSIKILHLTCSVITLSYWIILLKFEQFYSSDSENATIPAFTKKTNNGQTQSAIFLNKDKQTVFFDRSE